MLHVEKSQGLKVLKHYDWFLVLLVIALNAFGMIAITSVASQINIGTSLIKQTVGIVGGSVAMIILSLVDYKDLKILGFAAYGLTTLLLVLVLIIGIGEEEKGMQGWLDLGLFTYQPSEVGKVTFVVMNALYLENIVTKTGKYNYLKLMFFAALPIALVLMQPDVGTSLVYMFIFIFMVFFAGIPYKYIFAGIGAAAASLTLVYYTGLYNLLPGYMKSRFSSFFNKEADPLGSGYQVRLSMQYAGSGQLWGRGWGNGFAAETVPESQTDFIFSVIAEEFGFIGAAVLIILFLAFFARCVYIAWYSRDRYGSYIVMGLVAMMFAHFLENIGMNIGLLPVTGIPLPFVSYGVSSVTTNLVAVGIILSISLRKKRPMFE
jgi:rod shape determining protein RodA